MGSEVLRMHVLFLVLVGLTTTSSQSCQACNQSPPCKPVTTVAPSVNGQQVPTYESALVNNSLNVEIDSVCNSIIPLQGSRQLAFRVVNYKSGQSTIDTLLIDDYPGQTGVYRVQGLARNLGNFSRVSNDYLVGYLGNDIYLLYNCPLMFEDCANINTSTDSVFVSSTTPTITQDCLVEAQRLVEAQGLCGQLIRVPGNLPAKCVTSLNGVKESDNLVVLNMYDYQAPTV